ncbi:uncharacterized protein ACA1_258990 [Acanthamoeba castellanii str. Neff]|uniref:Uncharacterized protein n=1 Tax=Acanthamoeba castellanii (strain ATCC 30010 / Neff) TaxID=1257118 RepID=L8GHH4_ACACF|nr:uncharacterized protein ACA1_258990 [Acanthamoeba castellanii str. Neff]ELR11616.1 hypothetical protein ACA1_258990 [Acanthamoeba castellanii str. Neff]
MLWFAGGVTVAVTSLWLAFGLLRRYMRATPLPTDLTARQRVLLGLPPVADTPDKTTPRRPPAARVIASRLNSLSLSQFVERSGAEWSRPQLAAAAASLQILLCQPPAS